MVSFLPMKKSLKGASFCLLIKLIDTDLYFVFRKRQPLLHPHSGVMFRKDIFYGGSLYNIPEYK